MAPLTRIADALVAFSDKLSDTLDKLDFAPPVAFVYNPLSYAAQTHHHYLRRYGALGPGRVVLLGMNPGPWGMAQTGVPFGEIRAVREWMKLDGKVTPPPRQHPKKPVYGFSCPRSEVSGARLWGWAAERFREPFEFFSRFFVVNYCPLLFLEEGGRNRTPEKLPAAEGRPLEAACDSTLRHVVQLLEPSLVVGVGVYAEKCALRALDGTDIPVGRILHPSPASPAANRGWAAQAERELAALGVDLSN